MPCYVLLLRPRSPANKSPANSCPFHISDSTSTTLCVKLFISHPWCLSLTLTVCCLPQILILSVCLHQILTLCADQILTLSVCLPQTLTQCVAVSTLDPACVLCH